MRGVIAVLLAAVSAAGCKTTLPADPSKDSKAQEGTRNERDAEETVRQALAHYAAWNLEGAYRLICKSDRAKLSWEDFKTGSEQNKAKLVQSARTAVIVQSGEAALPDGTPYVSVIVKVGPGEVIPYSVIREPEGWRLILVDPKRSRQGRN